MSKEEVAKAKTIIHFQGTSNTVTVGVDMVEILSREPTILQWQLLGDDMLVNMDSVTYVEVIGK